MQEGHCQDKMVYHKMEMGKMVVSAGHWAGGWLEAVDFLFLWVFVQVGLPRVSMAHVQE